MGLLLAVLTVSFSIALAAPLGLPPAAIIAGTGIGVSIFLLRGETVLTPALPATAVVVGGHVGPQALVLVALVAGVAVLAASRRPAVVRAAQHPAIADVVRTVTGAGLCITTAGWALGATGRSIPELLGHLGRDHLAWPALAAMAAGMAVAVLTRRSKMASLLGGASVAATVGGLLGAPAIGAVNRAAHVAQADSADPAVIALLGLVMAAVIMSETATSAEVAGLSGSRHAIVVAGLSTLLAAPGGSPGIAPAPARTHAAGELEADASAVVTHLLLLVAVLAIPHVGAAVGHVPLAAVAVPVAIIGAALVRLNSRGCATLVATLSVGTSGGLVIGLIVAAIVNVAPTVVKASAERLGLRAWSTSSRGESDGSAQAAQDGR